MLSVLLLASTVSSCVWNKPGENPYTGSVVSAIQKDTSIPAETRAKLVSRAENRKYDDVVTITTDRIESENSKYSPNITKMNFGSSGKVCEIVTRSWPASTVERGLVYCEDGYCILVPTVCNNVSRITRLEELPPVIFPPLIPFQDPGLILIDPPVSFDSIPVVDPMDPPLYFAAPPFIYPAFGAGVWGGGGWGGGYCCCTNGGIPPTVPEPSTWILLLSGIAFFCWKTKK
jgi:hypothetical protein